MTDSSLARWRIDRLDPCTVCEDMIYGARVGVMDSPELAGRVVAARDAHLFVLKGHDRSARAVARDDARDQMALLAVALQEAVVLVDELHAEMHLLKAENQRLKDVDASVRQIATNALMEDQ